MGATPHLLSDALRGPAHNVLVRPALDLVPVLEPLPVSLDALGRGPLPVSLDALGRGTPVVLHNALTGV